MEQRQLEGEIHSDSERGVEAPSNNSKDPRGTVERDAKKRPYKLLLTINGTDYKFDPIGSMIRVFAQERIAEERRKLWDEARDLAKEVGGEIGKGLIVEAYRIQQHGVISAIDEALVWLASPKGDFEFFCRSIKPNHPSLTAEDLQRLYDRCTAGQLNLFREFQYQAYNPDDIESTNLAATEIEARMDEIPESLQESVQVLVDAARRIT